MNNTLVSNWIKYYRNSLADGELSDISPDTCKKQGHFLDSKSALSAENLKSFYARNHATDERDETKQKKDRNQYQPTINILISPFYISTKVAHGKNKGEIKKNFPFWIEAKLTSQGTIIVDESLRKPWICRSFLEPISIASVNWPILSTMERYDSALENHRFDYKSFDNYWESAAKFFEKITGYKDYKVLFDEFNAKHEVCMIKSDKVISAQIILNTYADLQKRETFPLLLTQITDFSPRSIKKIPDVNLLFAESGHYGQFNDQFPLSNSQRKSLLVYEQQTNGNILAVNGPPGTGKTTLLQSILANELVKSVLNGARPPRLVASSTNNQAITNILDSFGNMDGNLPRWIPELSSLGTYMISTDQNKQNDALKKGYQLLFKQKFDLAGHYFDHHLEPDIHHIEKYYISCFRKFADIDNRHDLKAITDYLKKNIVDNSDYIDHFLSLIKEIHDAEKQYCKLSSLADFTEETALIKRKLNELENRKGTLKKFKTELGIFLKSIRLVHLFSFIPYFKKKLHRKLSFFLIDAPFEELKNIKTIEETEDTFITLYQRIEEEIAKAKQEITKRQEIYNYLYKLKCQSDEYSGRLETLWQNYLQQLDEKRRCIIQKEFNDLDAIEQFNCILDVSLRYDSFVCAVHYWEGKWIMEQKGPKLKANNGKPARENLFSRMSYLTPLFISTFHSLPNFASYSMRINEQWVSKPLYELFDILIVDEAGQVSPEVGVPAFSLAKKAIVVGDVYQIEPVWNVRNDNIDKGNLKEANLLLQYSFDHLKEKGVLCSSGNLMFLAQHASDYSQVDGFNGTLLTEHRRCVNELIAFSNDFVYNNTLRPMVGSSKGVSYESEESSIFIPPLAYIHIAGDSTNHFSGSLQNKQEAEAIAKWIARYGDIITTSINKEKPSDEHKNIEDCLAIVTPFSAQKTEIKKALKKYNVSVKITVGTVHALQGAEKTIIIFSSTYGKNHNGNLFFDNGPNMLNVALTRAKQHFIVMGNMRLFNPTNTMKPSGALAHYLFSSAKNELSSSFLYDDVTIQSEYRVNTIEKHRACLKRAFEQAQRRIVIVSPYISQLAIEADDIIDKITKLAESIEILVYTDKFLDQPNGQLKENARKGRQALEDVGVTLKILNGIHNKALAIDDYELIEGSFNWLSAVRDRTNQYYRHEVSQIIREEEALIQIKQLLEELKAIEEKG
ncbi:hypothetical protein H8S90_01150 [Olivibacter sp. SDN3]|uniref:AAA domain-containing protein n=1 Tax=Olivibacter sp. SDN3 TaxID=2764720 RepID=UPI001651065B|nr:AAA domain-containing protein [Olivibacter sp. SDN3]QNL50269.1 hypothetical protein H8S90_01150 [Olivibacter sp. SDN3]